MERGSLDCSIVKRSCVWNVGRDRCVIVVVRICCEGLLSSNSGLV